MCLLLTLGLFDNTGGLLSCLHAASEVLWRQAWLLNLHRVLLYCLQSCTILWRRLHHICLRHVSSTLWIVARHVLHVAYRRGIVLDIVASVLEVLALLQVLLDVGRVSEIKQTTLQLALRCHYDWLRVVLIFSLNLFNGARLHSTAVALFSDGALTHSQVANITADLRLLLLLSLRERKLTMFTALVDVDLAVHLGVVKYLLKHFSLLAWVWMLFLWLLNRCILCHRVHCSHIALEFNWLSSRMARHLIRFFLTRLLTDEACWRLVSRCSSN